MTSSIAPPARERSWQRTVITSVIIAIVVASLAIWYWQAHRKGVRFSADFTASVGIYPGSDVRILGVKVGSIDSVTPAGTEVKVGMHLDPGYNAEAGTGAVIISPNLVGDRYVELTGAYASGPKLKTGAVIPLSRTETPVEIDQLYQSLTRLMTALGPAGANKSGALSQLLKTGAANLGREVRPGVTVGQSINSTITQFSQAGSALAHSSDKIFSTVDNLSKFTTMLVQNNDSLQQFNDNLASVSGTLAADRASFGQAMHELASALGLVQSFVQDNRNALTSNVAKLDTVAGILKAEQGSIFQALNAMPLLVQNFNAAYDPTTNAIRGRGDLNDISIWSADNADTSGAGSPALLPGTGGAR